MATFNKINAFTTDMGKGYHVLGTDQLAVALTSNANAPVATNTVLANLTTVSLTNLSGANPDNVTTTSFTNTSGTTATLVLADLVLTATGDVGPFQHIALYNKGSTTKTNALIGWFSYASEITLHNTETFTIDFNAATMTWA